MSNNLNKSNIELNLGIDNYGDIKSINSNTENYAIKNKKRIKSEQPKRNYNAGGLETRPEDLFKSIEVHVDQKFKAMTRRETSSLINNINQVPKQRTYKMAKFSDTKFDNRHRLHNTDLATSFNQDKLKMPLFQKDLTTPEM